MKGPKTALRAQHTTCKTQTNERTELHQFKNTGTNERGHNEIQKRAAEKATTEKLLLLLCV